MQTLSWLGAFQNSAKSRPSIDGDVKRSSTDLATSMSVIHNIVTEMLEDPRNKRNAFPRRDNSVVQPYSFAEKHLQFEREDSRLKTSVQISVLELQNSEDLSNFCARLSRSS